LIYIYIFLPPFQGKMLFICLWQAHVKQIRLAICSGHGIMEGN